MVINNVVELKTYTRTSEEPTADFANTNKKYYFSNSFTGTFTCSNAQVIEDLFKSSSYSSAEAVIGREQKRKHKKRRINKKWAKRYGYYDIVLTGNLQCADVGLSDQAIPQRSFVLENPRVVKKEGENQCTK